MRAAVLASLALLSLTACGKSEEPAPAAGNLSVPVNVVRKSAVDVLFLIDNSNSMESMQEYLKQSFYQFFRPFDDLAAKGTYVDFHIGVVTSDFGAGATGAPGCTPSGPTGGGDKGQLIARGKKAAFSCVAPMAHPYIEYAYGPNGMVTSNLPPMQGLADTFTCMASMGANGCGFEHQLEAVYRALSGDVLENQGFLREEAALAVVFLTNEDDASAPPESDIFDKNLVGTYGYESSYPRQTRHAIVCGNPPELPPYGESGGPLANCRPAPNPNGKGPGIQYDVQRYIDFFTLPKAKGGVKADPADVILYAIDGPETPFEVILANPATPAGLPWARCGALNESSNPPCVPVLQHSCMNMNNPNLFAAPSVRINAVIKSAANHNLWSICDEDYSLAMSQFAALTAQATLGAGCLPESVVGPTGDSDCRVSDVLDDVDHETATDLPRCTDGGPHPCWRIEAKSICDGRSKGGWGLTIDRAGIAPPEQTHPRASCTPPQG